MNAGSESKSLTLPRLSPRAVLIGMGIAGGVLTIVCVVLLWSTSAQRAETRSAKESQEAATTAISDLLSYGPGSVATLSKRSESLVTADFGKRYRELVAKSIEPKVGQSGIGVRTEVAAAGVETISANKVTLIYFLNQTVTGSEVSKSSGSRVRVRMEKVDGKWKVADIAPI